ncbi:MAG: amidohydrolase family protein [candidate division WS1 bacterium]|nr:amidohydrolase family protein [candidate division WS1 bacterium]
MNHITYFDACCYLGRHMHMHEGEPETAEQILAAMDHYGIDEALVIDPLASAASPRAGNQRILERTGVHPRLYPAWAGLMPHSDELAPPAELVQQMRELGVAALYLFYGQYDMPLSSWALDELLGTLEQESIPLFLCPTNVRSRNTSNATDWDGVVRVCSDFPQLPVVVTEYRIYNSQRKMLEALAACPNLKVDLSAIWLHKRIEFICRRFGADRLVWGSQLPERNPGGALMQLNYSDISEDELALIAGGNMRQMLSWNPNLQSSETVDFPEPLDSLHRAVRERVSLASEEFYDCHGHLGWSSPNHVLIEEPADIVAEMDKFGVRACCVFSLEGVFADEKWGNDEVAQIVSQYPDRFMGFTLVNPNRGEQMMREELERGLELGMQGVKLIPHYHGYPDDGPLIDVACQFAHEHGQFILNHNWGSAEQMLRLCQSFPNACFFTGHSADHYAEVVKQVDNLYICTCPFLLWGQTERFVELYGADRLLFGSDLSDLPVGWGLGHIMYARISEADKRKILGENLQRLMARYAIQPRG